MEFTDNRGTVQVNGVTIRQNSVTNSGTSPIAARRLPPVWHPLNLRR